jgi:hypothetical protein
LSRRPSGVKTLIIPAFSARLKSCPDTKRLLKHVLINGKLKHPIGDFNGNSFPIRDTEFAQECPGAHVRLRPAFRFVNSIALLVVVGASLDSNSSGFAVKETKGTGAIAQEFCAGFIKEETRSLTYGDKRFGLVAIEMLATPIHFIAHEASLLSVE